MRLIPITKLVNHEVAYLIKELWEAIDNTNKRLDTLADDNQQLMAQISAKAEQPKPLLADARKGDLVRLRNGKYSQIVEANGNSVFKYQNPEVVGDVVALFWCDENGDTTRWGKLKDIDIISTEPLAPIGSAEWALQMMKLGKDVCRKGHEPAYYYICNDGKEIACSLKNERRLTYGHLLVSRWGKTGNDWQLYEPKQEPKVQVGDYVRTAKGDGKVIEIPLTMPDVMLTNGQRGSFHADEISVISPVEVVVTIGCLSGTVRSRDNKSFHLLRKGKNTMVIYFDALDTHTRKLVRELIEKQEGDAK